MVFIESNFAKQTQRSFCIAEQGLTNAEWSVVRSLYDFPTTTATLVERLRDLDGVPMERCRAALRELLKKGLVNEFTSQDLQDLFARLRGKPNCFALENPPLVGTYVLSRSGMMTYLTVESCATGQTEAQVAGAGICHLWAVPWSVSLLSESRDRLVHTIGDRESLVSDLVIGWDIKIEKVTDPYPIGE